MRNKNNVSSVDRCIYCGKEVPEGRLICPICEYNMRHAVSGKVVKKKKRRFGAG